jgi:hypothetical protein
MKNWWIVLAAPVALLLACTEFEDTDAGPGDAAADAGYSPSAYCNQYLTCVKAVKPGEFDSELELFKASADCWKSAAAKQNCEKLCQSEYDKLAQQYPHEEACGGTPSDGFLDRGFDGGSKDPTGQPCTSKAKCAGNVCLTTLTIDGKSTTMSGGYCSRDCSSVLCQSGEACFSETTSTGKVLNKYCLKTCTTPADCRTSEGYTCSSHKVCMPGSPYQDAGR